MGHQPTPRIVPELRHTHADGPASVIDRASDVGWLDLPEMQVSDGQVGAPDFGRRKQQEDRTLNVCTNVSRLLAVPYDRTPAIHELSVFDIGGPQVPRGVGKVVAGPCLAC